MPSTCIITQPCESSQATNSKLPGLCRRLAWVIACVVVCRWGRGCMNQTSSQENLPFGRQDVGRGQWQHHPQQVIQPHTPRAGQGPQGWAVLPSPWCTVYAPSPSIWVVWDFSDLYYGPSALSSRAASSFSVFTASLPGHPLVCHTPPPVGFGAPDLTHLQNNAAVFIRRHLALSEPCLFSNHAWISDVLMLSCYSVCVRACVHVRAHTCSQAGTYAVGHVCNWVKGAALLPS